MGLFQGDVLVLNGVSYHIGGLLGRGAIAETYHATYAAGQPPVVVRLLRADLPAGSREAAAMHREAEVLVHLNRLEDALWPSLPTLAARAARARDTAPARGVIALLDAGTDAHGRPFAVHELAPPAFTPTPLTTIEDERRVVEVFAALVRVVALCHSQGLALRDFDPAGGKGNRIRVAWTPGGHLAHLKLIDWNVTGGPEERPRDLHFLGGHLAAMLLHAAGAIPIDIRRPFAGAHQGDEMAAGYRLSAISVGTQTLLRRLLAPDATHRYASIDGLRADLEWWLHCLAAPDSAALAAYGWAVTVPWRQLAVAQLGQLRFGAVEPFTMLRAQADAANHSATLLALDHGRSLLRRGRYDEAAREFAAQGAAPHASPEVRRRASIFAGAARAAACAADCCSDAVSEILEVAGLLIKGHRAEAGPRLATLLAYHAGTPAAAPLAALSAALEGADGKASVAIVQQDEE